MELVLTDDQALFHETTVRFIETELPMEAVRALHDSAHGFDRGWWSKAAELGWFSLLVDEVHGGGSISGLGVVDATLVAEELGRHAQPGPFIPHNLVAMALSLAGSALARAELLPALMSGGTVATWAPVDASGNWDEGSSVNIERTATGFRVDGARGAVQDLPGADLVLVHGMLDGSRASVVIPVGAPGVTVVPLAGLDLSRRFARLELVGVEVDEHLLLGPLEEALHEVLLRTAIALVCAETVGAMDRLLAMTVDYAKDRTAFGRPIGSFQALKHLMADMALSVESARAVATTTARAVAEGAGDAASVCAMAASHIGEAGDEIAQEALQIHGGIGYTWEHDLHLHMRRIRTNAVLYGEPWWHRERLCRMHGVGETR